MAGDDVAKLRRLQATLEATAGTPVGTSSAGTLVDAYNRLRSQALEVADGRGLREEFEALFPVAEDAPERPRHPRESLQRRWREESEMTAQRASDLLHGLAGWFDRLLNPHGNS